MSVHEEPWPEGTPAWVDLMVPDRQAAFAFYGPLLGWDFAEGTPETGFYSMCLKDSQQVAGIGESPAGEQGPPPAWTTYIAVDDVEAAAAKVKAAGGRVLMEPMSVMDFGRMAVAGDPTGAVFGLWQSGTHTGANLVNEPGSVTWNEVMTRDFAAGQKFYADVFGYSFGDLSGEGFSYATINLSDQPVGGIGELESTTPPDTPPHWMTYFKVADTDAVVSQAQQLGGSVMHEPWNTEFGRMAVLQGPWGEVFSVMADIQPSSE
jgi:uncharacterized protein